MDQRMFTDREYQKAMERCLECGEKEECELFLQMQAGGQVVRHCPRGKANVV